MAYQKTSARVIWRPTRSQASLRTLQIKSNSGIMVTRQLNRGVGSAMQVLKKKLADNVLPFEKPAYFFESSASITSITCALVVE